MQELRAPSDLPFSRRLLVTGRSHRFSIAITSGWSESPELKSKM
jgi:hypothetical protein